jgi:AcrR family transcriptional regulator
MPTAVASPPPRRNSGRPKGADSANRREQILAAATELFSWRDFGVYPSARSSACGISLTDLVRYFPSKDFLLQATIERRDEADQAGIAGAGQARGWSYLESLVDLRKQWMRSIPHGRAAATRPPPSAYDGPWRRPPTRTP